MSAVGEIAFAAVLDCLYKPELGNSSTVDKYHDSAFIASDNIRAAEHNTEREMLSASFNFKKERFGFFKRKSGEAAFPQRLCRRKQKAKLVIRDKAHFGTVMRQSFVEKDCSTQRSLGSRPL